jgi:hypothetical protein
MTSRGAPAGRRVLLPPINFLFRLLQQRTPVQIWLYEQLAIRITGVIRVSPPSRHPMTNADEYQGFDEFMNLVVSMRVLSLEDTF